MLRHGCTRSWGYEPSSGAADGKRAGSGGALTRDETAAVRAERASSEGEATRTSGEDQRAACEGEDERAAYEGECKRRASMDEPARAAAASGSTAITVGTYPSPKQPGRSVGAADQTNAMNDESSGRALSRQGMAATLGRWVSDTELES
ncbi:hypothetical protein PC114_g18071 [Phytophthora cactorum]|uniref:Uncharacterized protein n=1 Tax=Phytophthora cactorum TaxID=29920 RepID=A0A8T1CGG3_9STRA|nr:hypothetical protein PC114_g18071 [Phytophthora cactorum]KAG2921326.1 hypothetical protein PC117_g16263 [Phytophthora cactorum]